MRRKILFTMSMMACTLFLAAQEYSPEAWVDTLRRETTEWYQNIETPELTAIRADAAKFMNCYYNKDASDELKTFLDTMGYRIADKIVQGIGLTPGEKRFRTIALFLYVNQATGCNKEPFLYDYSRVTGDSAKAVEMTDDIIREGTDAIYKGLTTHMLNRADVEAIADYRFVHGYRGVSETYLPSSWHFHPYLDPISYEVPTESSLAQEANMGKQYHDFKLRKYETMFDSPDYTDSVPGGYNQEYPIRPEGKLDFLLPITYYKYYDYNGIMKATADSALLQYQQGEDPADFVKLSDIIEKDGKPVLLWINDPVDAIYEDMFQKFEYLYQAYREKMGVYHVATVIHDWNLKNLTDYLTGPVSMSPAFTHPWSNEEKARRLKNRYIQSPYCTFPTLIDNMGQTTKVNYGGTGGSNKLFLIDKTGKVVRTYSTAANWNEIDKMEQAIKLMLDNDGVCPDLDISSSAWVKNSPPIDQVWMDGFVKEVNDTTIVMQRMDHQPSDYEGYRFWKEYQESGKTMYIPTSLENIMQLIDSWTTENGELYTVNLGKWIILNGVKTSVSELKYGDFIAVRYPIIQDGGIITPDLARATNVGARLKGPRDVAVTAPADLAVFENLQTISLEATATPYDGYSMQKMEFYVNGVKIGEDSSEPYTFDYMPDTEGEYDIMVQAVDGSGSTKSKEITIFFGNPGPLVNIVNPVQSATYCREANDTLKIDATDINGTVDSVVIFANDQRLALLQSPPYEYSLDQLPAGDYTVFARAWDNEIVSSDSDPVLITLNSRTPYTGSTISIPGKVEAENFDDGAEGCAWHDTEGGNRSNGYRDNVDVDIEDHGTFYNLSFIEAGEWVRYSINITEEGVYDLDVSFASGSSGGVMHIEIDGENISGPVNLPGTGGWVQYQVEEIKNILINTTGEHTLTFYFESGGYNLDYVNFRYTGAFVATTGITLDQSTLALEKGQTAQLAATVLPEDATHKEVNWESDNPGVATVDETGLVEAVASGNTTITVTTADNNYSATCNVTVTDHTGINTLEKDNFRLYPNPFNEQFTVESTRGISIARIRNLEGKILRETNETGSKQVTIKTSDLPKGIYFLEIISPGGYLNVFKLVRQ